MIFFFFLGGAISSDWAIRPYLFTYSFLFYQVFYFYLRLFFINLWVGLESRWVVAKEGKRKGGQEKKRKAGRIDKPPIPPSLPHPPPPDNNPP